MRLIDADAFKEYITNACEDMKHLFNDGGAVAKLITESFCKDIDEQPTIQPEPHWIPVSERLPEENLPVLVAVKQKNRLPKWVKEQTYSYVTDIDVYDDGGFYTHKNNVVAWMPLPEPYREEVQDD